MTKKINVEWTPELDKLADQTVKEEIAFFKPMKTNRKKAEAAMTHLYEVLGHKPVPYVWFDGPDDLLRQYAKDAGENQRPGEYARYYCDGQMTKWWFARYDFVRKYISEEATEPKLLDAILEVCRTCAGYLPTDVRCYMSEHPVAIHLDSEGRPHNMEGPAIQYKNGFGVYCVRNIMIPEHYITQRDKLTPAMVDKEENAEVRAILLELYGMGKYIADSKSVCVHEVPPDKKGYDVVSPLLGRVYPFGLRGARLWRRENEHGDIVQAVELINSTAHNGKRKTYWIGVTSTATTVEEAVAKSYGFDKVEDYNPVVES